MADGVTATADGWKIENKIGGTGTTLRLFEERGLKLPAKNLIFRLKMKTEASTEPGHVLYVCPRISVRSVLKKDGDKNQSM